MGKILETLRHAGSGQPPRPETLKFASGAAPDEVAGEEETPFIEVGPHRSFEASAAVLATLPAQRSPLSPPPSPPPASPAPPAALPQPHNVLFRSLIPPTRFAPELVAFHAPGEPASVRYQELLQAVVGAAASKVGEQPGVLLFSAVRPEVGATTTLLNVAITAARQGSRVVVVDANLRRPAVAGRLGLVPAPGLTEVLAGDQTLEEALRPTEQKKLTALTAGSPMPTLASLEALLSVLHELRGQFDLVLVDGPRWDGRTGVTALASICDAVFLVVPVSEADTPPASELVHKLPEQGVCLAGCILTGV